MEPNNSTPTPSEPKQSHAALIIILTVAALAIAIVAAILINGNSSAPSATQNKATTQDTADKTDTETTPDTTSPSETATTTFTSNGFSPSTLTVKKGTKLTVVNKSSEPVQFSSGEHPTHTEDPELNMDELAPGESGSITVTVVGTHEFHDHNDDSKTGTLIVTE